MTDCALGEVLPVTRIPSRSESWSWGTVEWLPSMKQPETSPRDTSPAKNVQSRVKPAGFAGQGFP